MDHTGVAPKEDIVCAVARFGGIYDVPEVARYLKADPHAEDMYPVSSTKLLRWIRQGIASPDLVNIHGAELLVDFEDLISMRVVASLRAVGVSWGEIHGTRAWLQEVTGVERPLATEHVWAGQGQIYVDWTQRLISASRHGQYALDIMNEFLIPIHGLVFDDEAHVATSWEPLGGVVLQPEIQFGAPCIKGTRIPTRTIWGMVEAGDSVGWIADVYGISQGEVEAACEWESLIQAA